MLTKIVRRRSSLATSARQVLLTAIGNALTLPPIFRIAVDAVIRARRVSSASPANASVFMGIQTAERTVPTLIRTRTIAELVDIFALPTISAAAGFAPQYPLT